MSRVPVRRNTSLDSAFSRGVERLSKEGKELVKAQQSLSERILKFAQDFEELWGKAKTLDGKESGAHQRYLRDRLAEVVGTTNKSIWSRWSTIGSQAKALLPYSKELPAQRDSMYELALAKKEGKSIASWVKQELVTPQSTVREVSALRKATGQKKSKRKRMDRISITLELDCSYEEAGLLLQEVVRSSSVLSIKSHQAFREAIKSKLGPDAYEEVKDRFG